MSKAISATCAAGVVSVNGVTLPGVVILSEGQGQSEGILLVDESNAYYLAKTSGDMAALLPDLTEAIEKTLDLVGSVNDSLAGSSSAPYPTFATDRAAIDQIVGRIETLAGNLR